MNAKSEFAMKFTREPNELRCRVTGRLDHETVSLLEGALDKWLGEHCGDCVLDLRNESLLSRTSKVEISGLAHPSEISLYMFQRLHDAAISRGNRIIFLIQPNLREAFRLADLDCILEIAETPEEVESLLQPAAKSDLLSAFEAVASA